MTCGADPSVGKGLRSSPEWVCQFRTRNVEFIGGESIASTDVEAFVLKFVLQKIVIKANSEVGSGGFISDVGVVVFVVAITES